MTEQARVDTLQSILIDPSTVASSRSLRTTESFNSYFCCLSSLGVELWSLARTYKTPSDKGVNIITILICVAALVNAALCLLLICKPSKEYCLYSVLFSVISIILYIVLLGYGAGVVRGGGMMMVIAIICSLQIVIQFIPIVFMYRFWSYLTYNHDFDSSSGSSGNWNSRRSLGNTVANFDLNGSSGSRVSDL